MNYLGTTSASYFYSPATANTDNICLDKAEQKRSMYEAGRLWQPYM